MSVHVNTGGAIVINYLGKHLRITRINGWTDALRFDITGPRGGIQGSVKVTARDLARALAILNEGDKDVMHKD